MVKTRNSGFFAEEWANCLQQGPKYPIGEYLKQAALLKQEDIEYILDLQQKIYNAYTPMLDIKSLDINKIDTKNGFVELELKYDFIADFDDSFESLWKVVTDNIIFQKDNGKYSYYVCDYNPKEFQEILGIPRNPEESGRIVRNPKKSLGKP